MILQGKNGTKYNIADEHFAMGGEGSIHDINGYSNYVAKIYKAGKSGGDKGRKLIKMVSTPPDIKPHPTEGLQIAWPADVLYNMAGQFVGFIMPRIKINEDLNVVYEYGSAAKYPEMPWENRVIIAENLCAVLHAVHMAGHVCGDFNPKNISVKPQTGFVVLLDTDSYHIKEGSHTYRCDVGIPEYLPLEIQTQMRGGNTLASTPHETFTRETDYFALAVHIFQLLMNGAHPFACAKIPSQSSVVKPEPSTNIIQGYFPFMKDVPGLKIPVFAPEITVLPAEIQKLFKRAFIDGHNNPKARPNPVEWHMALNNMRKQLATCKDVPHHQYYKPKFRPKPAMCPWCKADESYKQAMGMVMGGGSHSQPMIAQSLIKPPSKPIVRAPAKPTAPAKQKPVKQKKSISSEALIKVAWFFEIIALLAVFVGFSIYRGVRLDILDPLAILPDVPSLFPHIVYLGGASFIHILFFIGSHKGNIVKRVFLTLVLVSCSVIVAFVGIIMTFEYSGAMFSSIDWYDLGLASAVYYGYVQESVARAILELIPVAFADAFYHERIMLLSFIVHSVAALVAIGFVIMNWAKRTVVQLIILIVTIAIILAGYGLTEGWFSYSHPEDEPAYVQAVDNMRDLAQGEV